LLVVVFGKYKSLLGSYIILFQNATKRNKTITMLGFVTGICREGRRNFGDQRTDVHKELCTLLVD